MFITPISQSWRRALVCVVAVAFLASPGVKTARAQNVPPRTPSETVREFYKAMRERRIREAFAMSIYKPAIEGLKPEEFADLQPDFEKMAAIVPETVVISGEQISGDIATVFMKVPDPDKGEQAAPVALMRVKGVWIIGNKADQETVEKSGKDFFFQARIETHQNDVQDLLRRLFVVELAYAQQHNGVFADLPTLIKVGLMPKDIEGTESTGYGFHVTVAPDAKSYVAGAEPARYGRTGRLSFLIDRTGNLKSADAGGKPLN
jgi:hypothetical protein